ncbi:MAG TPA: nitrate reductase subunit alpha [Candidatus Limnocylindrales bacterium]|nr:nitrate reductase subunit alpha [Candidatus Limnocylindrales bacterium]
MRGPRRPPKAVVALVRRDDTPPPPRPPGTNALFRAQRYFRRGEPSAEGWSLLTEGGRAWEAFYRDRWQHDKVVRSTHGVNCTGSCSWNVYVKDGFITWETQAVDYPSIGPDSPEYEPRGCPRGASFSWYTYSPLRVRYPYVRASLLELWRAARELHPDPVEAWAWIIDDPERTRGYKSERGRGGFVRASWDEVLELIAAAHVETIRRFGPDRIAGFSPIPAMSMVSHAAGMRFLSLIGGVLLSFYDWYADLPPSSPQVFGDQTDVPESADWWNASYLILWGTNLPVTRTPDAHFMVEARYRGQKVVVVSPDYADHTKFADDWLPAQAGTDAALAMAMGHVILTEFWVRRQVPRFVDYARRFTDLPCLVTLRPHGHDGAYVGDRFLHAADLAEAELPGAAAQEQAAWKTVVWDEATEDPAVPNGSLGFRHEGGDGPRRWNLELGDVVPALTMLGRHEELVRVKLPRFDQGPTEGGGVLERGVPARRVGGQLVTTVYDLLLAQYGVAREDLPGTWPTGYEDAAEPYTPAWQEAITSVEAARAIRVAREFARNAERSGGRSMIAMGAGTNHWFHSDQIYRSFLTLLLLCGCEGVNGGGWAHYVGQEKVRPLTGWSTIAMAADWVRPTRQQAGTPFWYLATDQWRYEVVDAGELASPLGEGLFAGRQFVDCNAQAARLGWLPSNPTFDRNPLDLVAEAEAAGVPVAEHVVAELQAGRLAWACEDPDAPENFPRVVTVWRANLLTSSGKGHEYFLKHLLGSATHAVRAEESPPEARPRDVRWRDEAPEGKVDLMVTADFRMTGTCLFSDVVLPAATWYEKHDLSSTDLHPFVNSFSPAIAPPWEARTDWDTFGALARRFSALAGEHLGRRRDLLAVPLLHDTPDELAQPDGVVRDWRAGEVEPIPGRTMPRLVVVERDYGAVADKWAALGPLVETLGTTTKGLTWKPLPEVEELGRRHGRIRGGVADGRPSLARAEQVCDTILALSGTTNGHLAMETFRALEARTGLDLSDLAAPRAGDTVTYADTQAAPSTVITSAEWTGIEAEGRRYAPFTQNVERGRPWHTLSGRQHLYLDHAWMREMGDALPAFRPPLDLRRHYGDQGSGEAGALEITVRYLTPHSKMSIHSEYQDNLHMLRLLRGGPGIWMNAEDAVSIDVHDHDWIEAFNRNGVVACRVITSHRLPRGVCIMYHAKDRHVGVPLSEISGKRGGTDNSLTRLVMKPTHMIGGYAQLSWGFNYYGPTGTQRDEITVIRKRRSAVAF